MRTPVSVGVVGLGSWGPQLARGFESSHAELRWLCDHSLAAQLRTKARHPSARVTLSIEDLLQDDELDAVVVATPSATHYELARRALEAGKHVFVEGPLALRTHQADELVRLSERMNRRLMVGDLLLFHPAVRKLKELIELGRLGDVYYLYGSHQRTFDAGHESPLWTIARHDVSLLLYLLGDEPVEVAARGEAFVRPGIHDVIFCHLRFATGISAHLHVSCLDVQRAQSLTVVGSKRMAVFDDMELLRKLTVYDKGRADERTQTWDGAANAAIGDIVTPRTATAEPLRVECEYFLAGIRSSLDAAGARHGAAVVNVLEALERSLAGDAAPTTLVARSRSPQVIPLPLRSDVKK